MNIYITENQSKLIQGALLLEHATNDVPLIKSIDELLLKKLYAERLQDVSSCFTDDISSVGRNDIITKLNKVSNICKHREEGIRPQLERLCFDVITELFNVPQDAVSYECHLVDQIKPDKTFHVYPHTDEDEEYDDYSAIESESNEIEKRRIIQSLCIGAAMDIYESSRKLYINELFELDEELPHLYSKYIKINNLATLLCDIRNTDKKHHQGGYVNVNLGTDNTQAKIMVEAVNFPILLIESIRGFMELFASFGLPDSKPMARKVIDRADTLEDEPWHMKYGPVLWKRLENACGNMDTTEMPYFFKSLATIDCNGFNDILREVFYGTKRGRAMMSDIKDDASHQMQYSDFEKDMLAKQNDKVLIDDSFNAKEIDAPLLEDYPTDFDIEKFKALRSFRQRIMYCEQHLTRISSGSGRIVYRIDDEKVLKLAKNQKGIAQNEEEGYNQYLNYIGLSAKVYAVDDNYLWIEMELARRATVADFKRLTGFSFKEMCSWCDVIHSFYGRRTSWDRVDKDLADRCTALMETEWYEDSLWQKIEDYMSNYQLEAYGDLKRISSWGVVKRNGEEEIVLVDFGLSDDVRERYYE